MLQLNRIAKLVLGSLYFAGLGTWESFLSLFGRKPAPTCVALIYHSISKQDAQRFARQMDAVRRYTTPLPADHREPLEPGKRYCVITIDDAFQSANENALPELIRRKIPVAVFVSPELLETTPEWITFDGDELANEQVVSANVVKSWPKDLVTVGSHTLTHPWLPTSTEEDARAEIAESRTRLTQLLGRETTLFSFPYGAFNDRLVRMCREAGYQRVFTSLPNLAFAEVDEFVTGRLKTEPTDWPIEFRLKLLGAYRWLPKAFALKRKLLRRAGPSPTVQPGVKQVQH